MNFYTFLIVFAILMQKMKQSFILAGISMFFVVLALSLPQPVTECQTTADRLKNKSFCDVYNYLNR